MPAGNTVTTLVGNDRTQSLTNKTIADTSSNVRARALWAGTTPVSTFAAAAPSSGQSLIATSASTATWQTIPGYTSGATAFVDNTFLIQDDVTAAKKFRFEANVLNSATTIFKMPAGNTITTLVGNDRTQSLTNKTITGTTNTVRATQLATTTSDVVISAAILPVVGQVLTSITTTTAKWKDIVLPTGYVDMQTVSSNTTVTTTSTTYTDLDTVTPFTLTTSNVTSLKYLIIFSGTWDTSNGNRTASFILNVNGTDDQSSEKILDAGSSNDSFMVMTQCQQTLGTGVTIKVRYKVSANTVRVYNRVLTIYGIKG
jgi:hypothetical protein